MFGLMSKIMNNIFRSSQEEKIVRRYYKAASVGRLMLHEFSSWHDYLEPETMDLDSIPRRQLKDMATNANKILAKEILKFCNRNFDGMTIDSLVELYEEIKGLRGLEIPLEEFESRFAKVNPIVYKGHPKHLTLCFSLWGLQFRCPEDEITKDICEAIDILEETGRKIHDLQDIDHIQAEKNKSHISDLTRKNVFASRSILYSSFNLLEAYLNGLSWCYCKTNDLSQLSKNDRKILEDHSSNSLKDKLIKIPRIISGTELWDSTDQMVDELIGNLKKFRDAMVHASPFSAPEKYGGYNKLRLLYNINEMVAIKTVGLLYLILSRIDAHIDSQGEESPRWLHQLKSSVDKVAIIEVTL